MKRVLLECQTHFFQVVAVKDIYRELCHKDVIHQTVANEITHSHSVEEARGHLFDHMRDYGTLATLNVFCDVISSDKYNGFRAMQDFGAELRRRLVQEGRFVCVGGWGWWCADGAKSFGPMNSERERELELLMASNDSTCVCL